jgi:cation transport ATPase
MDKFLACHKWMKKRNIAFWIGITLLVFTLLLLPELIPPQDPDKFLMDLAESSLRQEVDGQPPSQAAIDERYQAFLTEQWIEWVINTILAIISITASILAMLNKRMGLFAVCGASWLVTLFYVFPLFTHVLSGLYFRTASVLFSMLFRNEPNIDVLLILHIVFAPAAYLLLALISLFALIKQKIRAAN